MENNKDLENGTKKILEGMDSLLAGFPSLLAGLESQLKSNPEAAKEFAKQMKDADVNKAVKDLKSNLSGLNNIFGK